MGKLGAYQRFYNYYLYTTQSEDLISELRISSTMSLGALIASTLSEALPWQAFCPNNHCSINSMISFMTGLNLFILIISCSNPVLEF
jgi:hypothetical protein